MSQHQIFERARLSRDPRFDGRFFVGVHTTGIYCRPVCPANPPKSENVSFYPSAAAAGEAGFRPCLRCRPECAPGSPAWNGTSTTVNRGLKLIRSGALDDNGVEVLAERLGVTSRHLRRLFTRHLGASPQAVAHTQRLHFAKRLIDETRLPMQDIALASGYGSVRRFNDAFRKTYGRTPRDLRRRGAERLPQATSTSLSVRLSAVQPYDWPGLMAFYAARAIPGVESVDGETYSRTVRFGEAAGLIRASYDAETGSVIVSLTGIDTQQLFPVVQRLRDLFDIDAPVQSIAGVLGGDPLLAGLLRNRPGIRVPGAWDGFELTVRAILGQQVSVKAATTMAGRIAARYGESVVDELADELAEETTGQSADRPGNAPAGLQYTFPPPERLRRARFNGIGLVKRRAQAIRNVAAAVADGDIRFDAGQDPADLHAALTSVRGVGDWTAAYVAMRAAKNPDALPASDLGLLRAFDRDGEPRMRPRELEARAERWRPWRAYAAMLLWSSTPGSGG